jgi:sugar/nucleoside kinase (ribokinase family)
MWKLRTPSLAQIFLGSPNAEEALSLLSIPLPVSAAKVRSAAARFLAHCSLLIIRCGELGAFIQGKEQQQGGCWIEAFWGEDDKAHIVDVTGRQNGFLSNKSTICSEGAGNCFLGGLSAGIHLNDGDIYRGIQANLK